MGKNTYIFHNCLRSGRSGLTVSLTVSLTVKYPFFMTSLREARLLRNEWIFRKFQEKIVVISFALDWRGLFPIWKFLFQTFLRLNEFLEKNRNIFSKKRGGGGVNGRSEIGRWMNDIIAVWSAWTKPPSLVFTIQIFVITVVLVNLSAVIISTTLTWSVAFHPGLATT